MADSEAAAAHQFRSIDAGIALEHGVPAAFVHHQIGRWCAYNQAEAIDAVLIDGAYWMYISHERLHAALPWYTVRTIRRAIETLNRAQLLHKRLRKGTKAERSGSPAALLYRAINYVDAGVFKMNNRGGQNVQVGGGQNVHVEYSKLEPEKKNSVDACGVDRSKDQITREATDGNYAKNGHGERSTDGFQHIGQTIDGQPPENTQPQPRRPKPLSPEQIKEIEAAKAAKAAEDEERLIPELRNLVAILLESRHVPQPMRETIEAALQKEIENSDVLCAWVNDLQAMSKLNHEPVAVAEPEAATEAAG